MPSSQVSEMWSVRLMNLVVVTDSSWPLIDITLLIIDECHHTQKETIYNKIMRLYVEKKLEKGRLPQILGLTASPGTGGAKCLQNAVEHVLQVRSFHLMYLSLIRTEPSDPPLPPRFVFIVSLPQICANLDSAIVSSKNYAPELERVVPKPVKRFDVAEPRPEVSDIKSKPQLGVFICLR